MSSRFSQIGLALVSRRVLQCADHLATITKTLSRIGASENTSHRGVLMTNLPCSHRSPKATFWGSAGDMQLRHPPPRSYSASSGVVPLENTNSRCPSKILSLICTNRLLPSLAAQHWQALDQPPRRPKEVARCRLGQCSFTAKHLSAEQRPPRQGDLLWSCIE